MERFEIQMGDSKFGLVDVVCCKETIDKCIGNYKLTERLLAQLHVHASNLVECPTYYGQGAIHKLYKIGKLEKKLFCHHIPKQTL